MKKLSAVFLCLSLCGVLQAQNIKIVDATACEPTSDKDAIKAFQKAEKAKGMERIGELHRLIQEYPDYYEALFAQAHSLIKLNKPEQAKPLLERVYELCPNYSPYTWYYLGALYFGDKEYDKAIPVLELAATYDKESPAFDDSSYSDAKAMLKDAKAAKTLLSNRVAYDPQAVRNICTNMDEYTATLSPDNELLYFIRKVPDSKMPLGFREVFMESKNTAWIFDRGQELPPPFNVANNNGAATITADNKTMYFVNCQNNEFSACDIWYSERKSTGWTTMSPVQGNLNQGTTWESCPSVSFDGKEMIFTSKRPGGQGEIDLYSSKKMPDGTWAAAQNLGSVINSPYNENTPFLHSDSKTLYFSSKGHDGLGGYDIYFSRQDASGKWSKPINIGSPINTEKDEVNFFVSLDGKRAFFSSGNLNGPGGLDVYMFYLHEDARPQPVKLVKGEIKSDPSTPKDAEVEIKNLRTKEVQKVEVDKEDGKYVAVIDAKEDYVLTLKKQGMAFSSQLIEKDAPVENGVVKTELEMKKIETGKAYNINNINFASNSAELSFKSKAVLEGFSDFLKTNPNIKVTIQGHTDNVGDDQENLALSENRAQAVRDYLVSTGIASARLSAKGFGETKPVADNSTENGRARNRRTEFLIISQ